MAAKVDKKIGIPSLTTGFLRYFPFLPDRKTATLQKKEVTEYELYLCNVIGNEAVEYEIYYFYLPPNTRTIMETKKMKVYNVIILDKSGSMSSIARQAVDGVNETIGSIKSAQEKNPDQEHIVTLVAFCGCELKSIYDNAPVSEVKTLTDRDYRPCCMTPLYDAIGTTISRVHTLKSQDPEIGRAHV